MRMQASLASRDPVCHAHLTSLGLDLRFYAMRWLTPSAGVSLICRHSTYGTRCLPTQADFLLVVCACSLTALPGYCSATFPQSCLSSNRFRAMSVSWLPWRQEYKPDCGWTACGRGWERFAAGASSPTGSASYRSANRKAAVEKR